MTVYLVWYYDIDRGLCGIFETRKKARAYIKSAIKRAPRYAGFEITSWVVI